MSRDIALPFLGPSALDGVGGQPHAPAASTPGKDPVHILQEAGWAPGPVWTGRESRPHRDSIPDRQARSQSLYRLSYPAHTVKRGLFLLALKRKNKERMNGELILPLTRLRQLRPRPFSSTSSLSTSLFIEHRIIRRHMI